MLVAWAVASFVVAVIAAIFGFTGIAVGGQEFDKILLAVFAVVFLVLLVASSFRKP